MRTSFMVLSLLGITVAACSDPNALAPASETNVIDTIALFSLDGTPVSEASGFAVELGQPVRTDIFSAFDFVFTVDPQGQPWLVPSLAVGMPGSSLDPGLLPQGTAAGGLQFDQITLAPFDGYLTTDSLKAAVGNTYVVRSRIICSIGVPRYAKIEILELNLAPDTLRISLKLLDNFNCGYRGLEPGLPDI
ncbi:MAG: hypothetical protein E2O47_05855 [Gemmatimonadetes bacterium]|nr:MAG: hypothetical protein E2O47_05855 [Gemmatimonadota bacterium]